MSTSKEYRDFTIGRLQLLENVTYRAMMGEYLLYNNGVLFGGIYDNRLLIKPVMSNKKYNLPMAIPYESAKPMYLLNDDLSEKDLQEIIYETLKDLPNKKA